MSVPPMLEKSLPLSATPGNVKKYKYLNGALFLFEAKTYYLIPHDVMAILHPTFDHQQISKHKKDELHLVFYSSNKDLKSHLSLKK